MKQSSVRIASTFAAVCCILMAAYVVLGWQIVYVFTYAVLTIGTLSAAITLTRLAAENPKNRSFILNLAIVNYGASAVLGWWSFWRVLGRPAIMQDSPIFFALASVYVTGVLLHLYHVSRSWPGIPYRFYIGWLVALSAVLAYLASLHADLAQRMMIR
mgnify:CR=1 FL=1